MKYLYFFLILNFFWGCKKEDTPIKLDGTYSGTFTAYSGDTKITASTEIVIENERFRVVKGYKLGSGNVEVKNGKEVVFDDENIWTAEFDWSLLLRGNYNYEINGDNLILTRYAVGGSNCFLCKDLAKNRNQYKLKKK